MLALCIGACSNGAQRPQADGSDDAAQDAVPPDVRKSDGASGFDPTGIEAEPWTEANAHFGYAEDNWLGGDAAYSVPLTDNRALWMFGDSFIATSEARVRSESVFVRNSIAILEGDDPSKSTLDYHWRGEGAEARAFFEPRSDGHWVWPGHGQRLASGELVVFLWDMVSSEEGLGFEALGAFAMLISNPDDEPASWSSQVLDLGEDFGATHGAAAYADATHVYVVATVRDQAQNGYLVRYRQEDLAVGTVAAQWWAEGAWSEIDAVNTPTVVIDAAHTEASLHFDQTIGRFVYITTEGFGASQALVRVAEKIEGPYKRVGTFQPPESMTSRPFVYAFKGHPELESGDWDLVITYATNAFEFADLFTEAGNDLYRPRFARLRFLR